jgi:hypothetical protein
VIERSTQQRHLISQGAVSTRAIDWSFERVWSSVACSWQPPRSGLRRGPDCGRAIFGIENCFAAAPHCVPCGQRSERDGIRGSIRDSLHRAGELEGSCSRRWDRQRRSGFGLANEIHLDRGNPRRFRARGRIAAEVRERAEAAQGMTVGARQSGGKGGIPMLILDRSSCFSGSMNFLNHE